MTFGSVEAKLLRLKCQCVCVIDRKMIFEQRANIKFCFKIGKTFTETFELMKKFCGDDCLSRARVHEWFTGFRDGRKDINDDEHTGRPKSVITENSIVIVREFIKNDNAPSHRSTLVTDFLTRNRILTINHSRYSPDMAPCDFYLFRKLHLAMKGKRFASVEAIEKACTDILKDIPVNDLKHSFEKLSDRAKQCIEAGEDYYQ